MKVRFWCDSGANIHSCKEETLDLAEIWAMEEEEARETWESMTEEEKYKEAEEWAWNSGLMIGYEEAED